MSGINQCANNAIEIQLNAWIATRQEMYIKISQDTHRPKSYICFLVGYDYTFISVLTLSYGVKMMVNRNNIIRLVEAKDMGNIKKSPLKQKLRKEMMYLEMRSEEIKNKEMKDEDKK